MKYCNTCGNQILDNSTICPNCGNTIEINNYKEAVVAALSGDNRGFEYLYNKTANDKYYIALKYMKNQEDADDVLQDAYLRAWSKLDTLVEPEKFPAWVGMIVANTAKNVLQKKNPMLFSDLEKDEGEIIEFQIEDESLDANPEISVTNQERTDIINTMLNSLSEEQRLCITMFYLEERSIKEIAEILECSENTVKSRLNYGRKNLAIVGEEMKQNGYQFYGMAPLPLLIFLIQAEAKALGINFGIGGTVATSTAIGSSAVVTSVSGGAAAGGTAGGTAVGGASVSGTAVAQGTVGGSASGASTIGVAANTGVATATNTGVGAGTQVATASSVAGTTVAKTAAGGFLKTIVGKVIVGLGAAAVVGIGAVAVHNLTSTTTIDDKTLLQNYYREELVPKYGLMAEYQASSNYDDIVLSGIHMSDIDDYNGDGVLDLYIEVYEVNDEENSDIDKNAIGNSILYVELYTIDNEKVVRLDRSEELQGEWYDRLKSMMDEESGYLSRESLYFTYKVKTDNSLFIVSCYSTYFNINTVDNYKRIYVSTYKNNKYEVIKEMYITKIIDCEFAIGYDFIDNEFHKWRTLYHNHFSEKNLEDCLIPYPVNITESNFMAEIGIKGEFKDNIIFYQEHELLSQVYYGNKDEYYYKEIYKQCDNNDRISTEQYSVTEESHIVEIVQPDYSQILADLKNNGTLPVGSENVQIGTSNSSQDDYGKVQYDIMDINNDGYNELVINDIISYYGKAYVYGYNPETDSIELKFSEFTYGGIAEFYDNGYVSCFAQEGQGLECVVYKYITDTYNYDNVFSESSIYAGEGFAPDEVAIMDVNENDYVLFNNSEGVDNPYSDDTYPDWFNANIGNANMIEIQYKNVGDYQGN